MRRAGSIGGLCGAPTTPARYRPGAAAGATCTADGPPARLHSRLAARLHARWPSEPMRPLTAFPLHTGPRHETWLAHPPRAALPTALLPVAEGCRLAHRAHPRALHPLRGARAVPAPRPRATRRGAAARPACGRARLVARGAAGGRWPSGGVRALAAAAPQPARGVEPLPRHRRPPARRGARSPTRRSRACRSPAGVWTGAMRGIIARPRRSPASPPRPHCRPRCGRGARSSCCGAAR